MLYNHEIANYREFIWMADTLKDSWTSFVTKLGSNTRQFLATTPVLFPTLLLSMILVIWRWISFRSTAGSSRPDSFRRLTMPGSPGSAAFGSRRSMEGAAIALVCIEFLLFYWLIGSYFERLTAVFNALLVCLLTMWLINRRSDRSLRVFLLIAVLGIHLYWMFSYGPFS